MIACIRSNKPGSFSNTIRTTWHPTTSQKLPFTSSCKPPIKTFKQLINKMSTSSESCLSSPDEYPFITTTKLSCLLLDQEMNFAVSNAFSLSPLSTTLLWNYLFLSHNIEHIRQDLTQHQLEQQSLFDILGHSAPFRDTITPIVLDRYRLLTHRLLFIPPSIAQLLKTLMRYDQLLFKNKVIVTIPSSLTTPLLSLTLELEKILLTLTNY